MGEFGEQHASVSECSTAGGRDRVHAQDAPFGELLLGLQEAFGLHAVQCGVEGAGADLVAVMGKLFGEPRAMYSAFGCVVQHVESDGAADEVSHNGTVPPRVIAWERPRPDFLTDIGLRYHCWMASTSTTQGEGRLGEVVRLFLRLGIVGFGGPAAHIAMMRDEVVRRRGWIDDAEFLDLVGATNLIPGPNSTELAIHLGHLRAGGRGLVLGGLCFIAPAVVIVSVLAWLYREHGTDPAIVDLRYSVLPVIIAIVAHALFSLSRSALTTSINAVVAVAAMACYLLGVHELIVLVAAGTLTALWASRHRLRPGAAMWLFVPMLTGDATGPTAVSLRRLFLVFLEIGSVLYGSGYVLLAFLQRNLVEHNGWLTSQQLLDAIAVGQVTPGPVFTTATFAGWQIDGPAGAAVATVGIFLPSFLFVAFLRRIVPWMRARPTARAFLTGLTTASLGLMAGVLVDLTRTALTDVLTVIVAVAALGVLIGTKINSAWLIGAGVVLGVVLGVVHNIAL